MTTPTSARARRTATILLVDDEPMALEYLQRVLRGYDLLCAADGSEGAAILRSRAVDLVIADYRMPGPISGLGLLEMCRDEYPRTLRVLMTGYADLPEIARAHADQLFEQLIPKPGSPAGIRALVESLLERARASAGTGSSS